ncbi:hypothetical protein [Sphingomonas sp. Ant H11]|jgi:hypothetical protein|uniref:hypothetical protein n=1 Tax=Sphingomonas sp. Ant H11 TaxID=1564113 RepID=UPI0012E007AB|nr:hypothetical protein [Sphingomonas sp. Ant H11]
MNAARGFTPNQPVVAAWGMGVDSTALIIEWVARSLPLSVVLTADTGVERSVENR